MSVERLDYLLKQGVRVPSVPKENSEFAVKLVVLNLAWHADLDGYVWVSDRTQAVELAMSRSTVWGARKLLERESWLIDTGQRKQKGVRVYKLVIPNYLPSGSVVQTTSELTGSDNGLPSGLASGLPSGLPSGSDSGSDSGSFCGLPYQAEKNIEKNENEKKEYNQFQKNNLDHLPDSVREMIIRKRRSKGSYPENNEITLGEALKPVVENLEKPTTDNEPF